MDGTENQSAKSAARCAHPSSAVKVRGARLQKTWVAMAEIDAVSSGGMIDRLGEFGTPPVWSLVITVFGDSVMPRGGVVSAGTLSSIFQRLSIRGEALRVALHRLAKDGWIVRHRLGRNSHYALSDRGRAKFLPASRRIYASAPVLDGPWRLVALRQPPHLETAMSEAGFLRLSPTLFLGPRQAGRPPANVEAIVGDVRHLPDWARSALAPEPLQMDYQRLHSVLSEQVATLRTTAGPEPLDAVGLRTLLIHHWRRLLLRHADLPAAVMPKGWRGEECRALVLTLHETLSRSADPWLDGAIGLRVTHCP